MENYGLITFVDTRLLVNKDTPAINKQFTSLIVSHEVGRIYICSVVSVQFVFIVALN